MKKILSLTLALSMTGLIGCASTTGAGVIGVERKQMMIVSSDEVMKLSLQSYNQRVNEASRSKLLDTNLAQKQRLTLIASKLINHVDVYRPDAKAWKWEVHTIKSDELNAFVMSGGKIMFYTGIIDRLNLTDDEIAAIMGHEMAHALREHARERVSHQYATNMGMNLVGGLLGLSQGQAQIAGIVSNYGIEKPHSRTQESEADVMGLELMARAGYNPEAAITLWQKMAAANKSAPPQFLSTHPSSTNRIATLKSLIPKVAPLYQQSRK
ncbi:MAG: M48 family metallopeptidase [Psychrobacter sp.]|nr:M48 family metallopeptidase [Psychrobacter sp.]